MSRRVVMMSLGGTITMAHTESGRGLTPSLRAADLTQAVPGIDRVAEVEAVTTLQVPSASLGLDDLQTVAQEAHDHLAAGADGVVVVQGTDTIEESAFALDLLLHEHRPIVVTGAMRGASAAGADGPANLLAAATVAASDVAAGMGCLVVMNDEIHAARFVIKTHTTSPAAFRSPTSGPLGHVAEGAVVVHARQPRIPHLELSHPDADANVALIRMGLGDDGRLLRTLPDLGYRGAVIEGMGAGHVPAEVAPVVGDLARRMPVVLAARVEAGPALQNTYGFDGSEIDLLGRGAIPAHGLSGVKARILLMLLLRSRDADDVAGVFSRYVAPT